MKFIYLALATMLAICSSSAQGVMIVSDPTNAKIAASGWAKSLGEAVTQSKTLMESKKLLMQSIDLYTKVSSTLQNIQTVKSIIDRQVRMVVFVNKELSRKDISSIESYKNYIVQLKEILVQSQATVSMVNSLLSSAIQMTQGERLALIMEIDKQGQESEARLRHNRRMFNSLNKAHNMLKPLKNMK